MSVSGTSGKTHPLRYAGRFLAGRPMDGKRRTNATWLHRGTRDLTDHGRTARWHYLPGWHRSAWRTGASVFVLAVLAGLVIDAGVTILALQLAACASLVTGAWLTVRWARTRRHHKKVVRPLYETSTLITGAQTVFAHGHGDNHKRYITVPRDYRNNPKTKIRLIVPPTWEAQPGQQKRLLDLVSRRLGGDWDMIPHLSTAYPPYMEFVPSPAPPDSLMFAQFKAALERGNCDKIMIGMGVHDRIIEIDLNSEAPHIAISMGTGGGKSSLLRLIVAYLIRHGVERVDIIDPKRVSHNWAKTIPGVHIYRTMAEQMEAIHNFRLRMESRYDALDIDDTLTFPRHVLIIEEQNSWMQYAKQYWEDYRNELDSNARGKTARRNPAIGDLAYILNQGRQACMNVFSVFQRMSASASGGGDMRENYGAKILARYSPQTWALLVGTRPVPRSSRINGRGRYVLGDEDHLVQFAFISTDEAIEYAMSGIRTSGEPVPPPDNTPEPDPMMSLREAVDSGVIPISYAAVRRARTRANGTFPAGVRGPAGTLYKPADLQAWYESRTRTGRRKAA